MSAKKGERILGPYEQSNGWRVIEIDATGKRESTVFASEDKARRYVDMLQAALQRADHTTESAFTEYRTHLLAKGTLERSIATTKRAVAMIFPEPIALVSLTPKRCQSAYDDARTRPTELTKQPPAADTHRNALVQTRSFLSWCVDQGWLKENPLAKVKGMGKRRPRGKSLGKEGKTMRVKEARAWYGKALELAGAGDEGAAASLVALLLGMRPSEIVSIRAGDLDEDSAAGDLLWIPCSKTPAGKRTLEVPEVLRPVLVAIAKGKPAIGYMFAREDGGPRCRDWIQGNVQRVCRLAGVPEVTAYAMRGMLATITAERGLAGHLIAATLGHESETVTMQHYAAPGAEQAGVNRRGLVVLQGGAAR